MKKTLIFKTLYLFLVLIVVAGASVFATNTYLASQVTYGNSNVEDALNGLFTLKENTYNYSTDEQVIGKWIDGKTLYRKILSATVNTDSRTEKDNAVTFYGTSINEKNLARTAIVKVFNGTGLPYGYGPSGYINAVGTRTQFFIDIEKNGTLGIISNRSADNGIWYCVVEYTKK